MAKETAFSSVSIDGLTLLGVRIYGGYPAKRALSDMRKYGG